MLIVRFSDCKVLPATKLFYGARSKRTKNIYHWVLCLLNILLIICRCVKQTDAVYSSSGTDENSSLFTIRNARGSTNDSTRQMSPLQQNLLRHRDFSWLAHGGLNNGIWGSSPYPQNATKFAVYSKGDNRLLLKGLLKNLDHVNFLQYKDDIILGEAFDAWNRKLDTYYGSQYSSVNITGSQGRDSCKDADEKTSNARSRLRHHAIEMARNFHGFYTLRHVDQQRVVKYVRYYPRGTVVRTGLSSKYDAMNRPQLNRVEFVFSRGEHQLQRGEELRKAGITLANALFSDERYRQLVSDPEICEIRGHYQYLDMKINIAYYNDISL